MDAFYPHTKYGIKILSNMGNDLQKVRLLSEIKATCIPKHFVYRIYTCFSSGTRLSVAICRAMIFNPYNGALLRKVVLLFTSMFIYLVPIISIIYMKHFQKIIGQFIWIK